MSVGSGHVLGAASALVKTLCCEDPTIHAFYDDGATRHRSPESLKTAHKVRKHGLG